MENKNMDVLTLARVLHAAEVERASTAEALEKALAVALETNDVELAAQLARAKRDKLLETVDKQGSIYRLEMEEPSGSTFTAFLPMLKKLAAVFSDPWAEYRRKLLDVPQQAGFPTSIEWPAMPGSNEDEPA